MFEISVICSWLKLLSLANKYHPMTTVGMKALRYLPIEMMGNKVLIQEGNGMWRATKAGPYIAGIHNSAYHI